MNHRKKIAVVVVNYKTPELVKACLASLKETAQDLEITVFVGDAESQDGSVEIISEYIDHERLTWATCFAIGCNGGFAYGNNAVVRSHVLPDPDFFYVYFLNPDTYIRPQAVHALVDFLQAYPRVGIVGSRLEDPDGSMRSYGFRAPAPWREFFRGARLGFLNRCVPQAPVTVENLLDDREVDWVTGASFMVRRDVLNDIGLMDEGYFLYFEETDLMTRARTAGYEVWHVAASRVVHLAGQATGVRTGNQNANMQPPSPFWLASRRRYMLKHFGPWGRKRADILFLAGDLVYRFHRTLRGQPIENPPQLWRAYLYPRKKEL